MMRLQDCRDSAKPSERLSLSPDLMPLSNNFSSIDSLNRYISHQNSTDMQQSGKLLSIEESRDVELLSLTERFNELMHQLQCDRSLSDTHLREELLDVASRIKRKKQKILKEYVK